MKGMNYCRHRDVRAIHAAYPFLPVFSQAFGWRVPIGGLGGLIGLGGGEFRLPKLMHPLGFDP
jgi:hypothetical protein